ncbi:MAG: hypothetical protein ACK4RK_02490 [Gemmataceae bacterium]
MTQTNETTVLNLGFLTILQEATGFVGGYLVTNQWGRPLEFRLSSAVQPNKVQQILYANTLQAYLCGELIGKTMVDKTNLPVRLIVTDTEAALHLRHHIDILVLWLAAPNQGGRAESSIAGLEVRPANERGPALYSHIHFPQDAEAARDLLQHLDTGLDLAEPFQRIREAIAEARKMGAAKAA